MSYLLIRYSLVPICISFVILYLCCFIPANDIPDVSFGFFIPMDKAVHFVMYLGLSGATAVNYIHAKRGFVNRLKLITGAFILPVLYGGFIEILQHYFFFPRMGDWDDFLANILGALVALFIAFQYRDYLIKKHI